VAAVLAGSAVSAIFSLHHRSANRPLYVALTLISFPIGFALSYVLMAVLFFGLFGLVALVMRLLGRDPLHRRYDPKAATYWSSPRRSRGRRQLLRQF
jgi:hypothetical protein